VFPPFRSFTRAVFRTILKTNNLAAGDFPDIQPFAAKLNEVKFSDFASFSQKQIDELDAVLNIEIPKLMAVRCLLQTVEAPLDKRIVHTLARSLCIVVVCFFLYRQELPSERDSPESLRVKMNEDSNISVPIPSTDGKFGKKDHANESNPFGFEESNETHYWYVVVFHPPR
jgi:Domain of unknown function (DUF5600)